MTTTNQKQRVNTNLNYPLVKKRSFACQIMSRSNLILSFMRTPTVFCIWKPIQAMPVRWSSVMVPAVVTLEPILMCG